MDMNKLAQSVSKLVLEDVSGSAEYVLERLPRNHRQFERIYLRDEIYDGEHPQRIEGLVVKPAVPPRVYRLYYPERRMIGWADYSGRDGKLKVRRKGSWVEPKSSIPDDRRDEMEQFLTALKEEVEVEPEESLTMRARKTAVRAHAGQFRKGRSDPYDVHPDRVSRLVARYSDDIAVAAAHLHDVLEDTDVPIDEYPQAVQDIVQLLTKGDGEGDAALRRVFESGNKRAMIIKVADRIDNVTDAVGSMSARWWFNRYRRSSMLILHLAQETLGSSHGITNELENAIIRADIAFREEQESTVSESELDIDKDGDKVTSKGDTMDLIKPDLAKKLTDQFIADYRARAERLVEQWPAKVLRANEKLVGLNLHRYSPQFTKLTEGTEWVPWFTGDAPRTWADKVSEAESGVKVDDDRVVKAAENAADHAMRFFEGRVRDKIEEIIGGRIDEAEIEAMLRQEGGVITGTVTVSLGDEYEFSMSVSLKTNYRYGENAANGYMTQYYQVPTIIRMEKGERPTRIPTSRELQSAREKIAKSDIKDQIRELEKELRNITKADRDMPSGAAWVHEQYKTVKSLEKTLRDVERKGAAAIDFISAQLLQSESDEDRIEEYKTNLQERIKQIKGEIENRYPDMTEAQAADAVKQQASTVKEIRSKIRQLKADKSARKFEAD